MEISPFAKDLIERVVRTFLAVLFGTLATNATTTSGTETEVKAAVVVAFTTAFTAAIGVATKSLGKNKDSASVIGEVEYDFDEGA